MPRCRVNAYLIEVRKLHSRSKENLKFGDFDGASDLRTELLKIMGKLARYSKVPLYQKVFRISLVGPSSRVGPIKGIIHSGDYGIETDIIDSDSGVVSYKKKKTESLPDPFYFHMELPPDEKRGILCLQQSGLSGVKALFETVVGGQFQKFFSEYKLHIRNLTMADALANYIKNGIVEEIGVEKHEIPADIADRFGGSHKTYKGKFTYSIKPDQPFFKRGGLIAFSKGEKTLDDIFDFDEHGFDVVKTKIRVRGELKTVNLTQPETISTSFDITDDVTIGVDGRPTLKSIAREFQKIVEETAERGGIAL